MDNSNLQRTCITLWPLLIFGTLLYIFFGMEEATYQLATLLCLNDMKTCLLSLFSESFDGYKCT